MAYKLDQYQKLIRKLRAEKEKEYLKKLRAEKKIGKLVTRISKVSKRRKK